MAVKQREIVEPQRTSTYAESINISGITVCMSNQYAISQFTKIQFHLAEAFLQSDILMTYLIFTLPMGLILAFKVLVFHSGQLGFNVLPKDTSAHRHEQPGIEPLMLGLEGDSPYQLSYSWMCENYESSKSFGR